jgi:D-beta-D-heptose 7-phosphate kinase / D-beta-D-heptose 1-phosphate adenosyltransferase
MSSRSCERMELHGRIRRNTRVLVVGDVMLDRYIWGDVERVSPEAPVPIVRAVRSSERPGGAANVAMNIAGLGAKATILGFCGEDADREKLENCLRAAGVELRMTPVATHPTTTKLRILGGKQQMLRLDMERTDGYPPEAYAALTGSIEDALRTADAVVLSDYAKGVLSGDVCRQVIHIARRRGVPVLVDPKQRNFARYHGAMTICPNLAELSAAAGVSSKDLDALFAAGQKMVQDLDLDFLTVTMSEKGIVVLSRDSSFAAPAIVRQVFDVSGAGDTVIATLALALASGLEMQTSIQLANVAAGIVVNKIGTVPIDRDELLRNLTPDIELQAREKVLSLDSLLTRTNAWRSAEQSLVFTSGAFDLLHIGHITLLENARREGDRLIVAVNSDKSVQRLKGSARPIVGEQERARVLAALSAVDAAVIFDDPTPIAIIRSLQPDVIVKGGDHNEDSVVGAKEIRSWGGRVRIVPTVEGFTTKKLIERTKTPVLP